MYSSASFWNMPGVLTTVSCAMTFHCWAELPGGSAAACPAVAPATARNNVIATPVNSRLPLEDGFALGVRLGDIKQPTTVVPVENLIICSPLLTVREK
jgi:hypothetical protein